MRKLFFAVSALAALALLAPGTGFAQYEYSNQVGLYLNPDGTGTGTMTVGATVSVYVVLTKPTDVENNEEPFTSVTFFDLMINFNPIGTLFKVGQVLPTGAMNIGDTDNINLGYLDYIVAWSGGTPVVNEAVTLVRIDFLSFTATPVEASLNVASQPSIPGEMSYIGEMPDISVMHSAAGALGETVFTFNIDGGAVPVQEESFGSVKALYR